MKKQIEKLFKAYHKKYDAFGNLKKILKKNKFTKKILKCKVSM